MKPRPIAIEELRVDARRVSVLLDQFELQLTAVGQCDRDGHFTPFATMISLLHDAAQHEPWTHPEFHPAGQCGIEVADHVTDLSDRPGQWRGRHLNSNHSGGSGELGAAVNGQHLPGDECSRVRGEIDHRSADLGR